MQQQSFEELIKYIKTCSLDELQIIVRLIIERIKEYDNKSKLDTLTQKLKDIGISFEHFGKNNGLHLQSLVSKTKQYPIINDYIIEFLLENNSCLDYQDETNGWTAIMYCVMSPNSSIETFVILFDHGASLNIKDKFNKDVFDYCLDKLEYTKFYDAYEIILAKYTPKNLDKKIEKTIKNTKNFELIEFLLENTENMNVVTTLYNKYKYGEITIYDFANLIKKLIK